MFGCVVIWHPGHTAEDRRSILKFNRKSKTEGESELIERIRDRRKSEKDSHSRQCQSGTITVITNKAL